MGSVRARTVLRAEILLFLMRGGAWLLDDAWVILARPYSDGGL